jgi:hypothetical protein
MRFRPAAFFDDQFRLHQGVEIRNLVERHNIRFKDSYREKAQYFKNIIGQRRGPESAAETIERAFEAALADCALEPARS